jgi:microtubule-associated protein, RP/EB family
MAVTPFSRRELLDWIRSLNIEVSCIEDVGKGAILCEILSLIYPEFPRHYKRNPESEKDYMRNLHICSSFFSSRGIRLYFPVEKLVKCRLQDNLEVSQWLARHYHQRCGAMSITNASRTEENGGKEDCATREDVQDSPVHMEEGGENESNKAEDTVPLDGVEKDRRMEELLSIISKMQDDAREMAVREARLTEEIQRLEEKLRWFHDGEGKSILVTFEKERGFYYSKCTMIERMLQEYNGDEGIKRCILDVLYSDEACEE